MLLFDRLLGLFAFFGVVAFFAGLLAGLFLGLAARVGLRLPLRDPIISIRLMQLTESINLNSGRRNPALFIRF